MAKAPVITDYQAVRTALYELVDRAIESAQAEYGRMSYEVKNGIVSGPHPDGLMWVHHTDTGLRTLVLEWQEVRHG